MIDLLDNLLRHLLMKEIDQIRDALQVRFQPPDEGWRSYVSSLTVDGSPANALNVYLTEVIENARLRSNELTRSVSNGVVSETTAPLRVDCQYLITAWSPAADGPAIEPTVDEHRLLYEAVSALSRYRPIVPSEVYAPDPLPPGFPEAIAGAELPVMLMLAGGMPRYADFWGTMGSEERWRPGVQLTVTLPVLFDARPVGSVVTTRITEYRLIGSGAPVGLSMHIAGHVYARSGAEQVPVRGAWVGIETSAGDLRLTTQTNELGRFQLFELASGDYRLRARAAGLSEITRMVSVPSPSGEYDLTFS